MWAVAMFDVPTGSSKARHEYQKLRNTLLDMGMLMSQYSVYVQHLPQGRSSKPLIDAIKAVVPSDGRVTVFLMSDREYSYAFRFVGDEYGKLSGGDPDTPDILTLF